MSLPHVTRKYLLAAISGTPDVLDGMLKHVPSEDDAWDLSPDSERFTLREVVAHLADWESVFRERINRTRAESEPTLQGYDECAWAVEHDYAHTDPHDSLGHFRQERAETVALIRSLDDGEWERLAHHSQYGPMTLEAQIAQIAGHDGYHTQQVAIWLVFGGH